MGGEKKTTGDFFVDEMALLNENTNKKKNVTTAKTTAKDIILNAVSAVAVMSVVMLCNLLITPNFHYEQLYSWNFGVLIVVNWICGILMTYFLRQSGINSAKLTEQYIQSEAEKQKAFEAVKDISAAQKRLDELIAEDFDARRENLEKSIAKLVRPKMPKDANGKVIDWKIGDPLPETTHKKIVKMKKRLEKMTPPEISIAGLAQSEASYNISSLYEIRPSPERTGSLWFVRKGTGKVGWFAVGPVVLSIIANGLTLGITIANVVQTIGIIGIMLFNAAREYTLSFAAVSRFGVDRNRQIVKILETVTEKSEKSIDDAQKI